jgi:predicted transcriptional regulator of viral defense system
MAKGTYISESLTEEQIAFMQLLEDFEVQYFSLHDLEERLQHPNLLNLNELVENLNHKGLLQRVERGKYRRPNFSNQKALASFLGNNGVIGYWSALHHHGLTERFPTTLFVKIDFRKKDGILLSSPIKFVSVKSAKKNFGVQEEGVGYHRYFITNVETTFIDCFDQLRYAGDFPDLIRAFATAKLRNQILIEGCRLYQNIALTKRMGYLASLCQADKLARFIRFARSQVNKKYNLFEAGGTDKGEFIAEWRLRLNLSESAIRKILEEAY